MDNSRDAATAAIVSGVADAGAVNAGATLSWRHDGCR